MSDISVERLFDEIGNVDEFYIEEAEEFDFARVKARRNKRIAYSAAGVAVVIGSAVAMYMRYKAGRGLKSA